MTGKIQAFPVVDIVVVGIRRSQAETKYQWAAWSLYLHTHSTTQDRIRKREVRKQQMTQNKNYLIHEEKVLKAPKICKDLALSTSR